MVIVTEEKFIEVCPVCGSSDWYYEAGGYTGKLYHCKHCGYIGTFIVAGNQEMIDAIKEDYKHKEGTEESSE